MADWYNPYVNQPVYPYGSNPIPQYGPSYVPKVQNSFTSTGTPQNTFQWVQGRAAAEAYLVAPGNSVILMDSNEPVIYYKSADANGRYLPMKTYDLVERVATVEPVHTQQSQLDTTSFVKRDEIADLIAQEVERQLAAPSK